MMTPTHREAPEGAVETIETDSTQAPAEPAKPKHPLVVLKNALEERRGQYDAMLRAAGIEFDTFKSAALTGVNKNPDLLQAEHASLFDALSQSCRDGLMPDGREGALVIHPTNVAKRGQPPRWVNKVAWMPMVRGVLKKIRSAPAVSSVHDGVIYKDDEYDYWIDDEGAHLKHRPGFGAKKDADIIAAYAIVRLDNGDQQVEVVGYDDLAKMQQASKSGKNGKGPWSTWKAQMCKKGAWHRLAPKLPLDDATMAVINRDEALYDFTQQDGGRGHEQDVTPRKAQAGRSARLGALADQHRPQGNDDERQHDASQPDL